MWCRPQPAIVTGDHSIRALKHLPYNARLLVEFLVANLKDRDPELLIINSPQSFEHVYTGLLERGDRLARFEGCTRRRVRTTLEK
jgi:hypothetical protein